MSCAAREEWRDRGEVDIGGGVGGGARWRCGRVSSAQVGGGGDRRGGDRDPGCVDGEGGRRVGSDEKGREREAGWARGTSCRVQGMLHAWLDMAALAGAGKGAPLAPSSSQARGLSQYARDREVGCREVGEWGLQCGGKEPFGARVAWRDRAGGRSEGTPSHRHLGRSSSSQ